MALYSNFGSSLGGGAPSKANAAKRKYGGTDADWDADRVPNERDIDPYSPTKAGPGAKGSQYDPNKVKPSITSTIPMGPQVGQQVADAFGALADEQQRQAEAKEAAAQQQAMDSFYQQMQSIMQGSAPSPLQYMGPSNEELQGRADTLAAAQFDPQIEAIRRMMGETQVRADRNRGELGNLYSALAGAYEQDVPKVQQTYQNAIDQSNQQQAALQQALATDYGARTSAIEQLAAQYGQQQAGAEATQPIANDQAFLQNLEQQIGASQQGALQQMQAVNTEYTRQGANLSRTEGSNRQADLMTELEDYMRQREGDISGLTSQRQAQATAAYMQMLSQAEQARQEIAMQNTSSMNQWRQGQWSQMMDLFQLQQAMQKSQVGEQPSAADMISANRLDFDKQQAMRQWVLDLTKDLKGQERVDAINFYMQQLGIS